MTSQMIQRVGFLLIFAVFGLSACGGDEQTVIPPEPGADIYYTYPYDGQTNVSTHADLIVRVSSPVTNASSLNSGVIELKTGGNPVPATAKVAANTGGRSIVVTPGVRLDYSTGYRLAIDGLETENGVVDVPDGGFDFTTRAAAEGPRSVRSGDTSFRVTRMIPEGGRLPIMDFSAFRFQFSQPLDEQSVDYGTSVRLQAPDGSTVDAAVVTRGNLLTVDPVNDLRAGATYTLSFSAGLHSTWGNALQAPFDGGFSRDFVPKESGPTEKMVLNAPEGGQQSPLTGEAVNLVPVASTLIDTRSQQGGDLVTELAFVPNYPEATPLRVPRGTRLTGDALDIKLGGEVDVGFDSGELGVELITDASGYLLPNPYSDQPEAPRLLRLFMDVGITTGNATAHAGFTQDVLHLEVVGKAIVEDGVLVGDGITVVETDLLGVDRANGRLSFHMDAYKDQNNAPAPREDTADPFVKSWMPGPNHVDKQRPGDPILINFNQPLAAESLENNITVKAGGAVASDAEIEQSGSTVIIRTDLDFGETYDIELSSGLTDLAGNHLATPTPTTPRVLSFTMPTPVTPEPGDISSPFVYTAYPGYPCVLTDQDFGNGIAGRCQGGMSSDDRLPIPELPANRAIRVHFSHPMKRSSFTSGSGFTVEELDSNGNVVGPVSGSVEFREQEVRFMPDEPWEPGTLYRYTLKSNGDRQSSTCDAATMICGEAGLPLKTLRLAQDPANAPATNGGGPDMAIPFRGAERTDSVFAHLDLRNTADLNANGLRYGVGGGDEPEGNPIDTPALLKNSIRNEVLSTSGSIDQARVGCDVDVADCPKRKFAYLNGALNVEIIGYLDPAEAASKVSSGELEGPLPPEVQANGGVLFYAYPTMVQASNLIAYSRTGSEPVISTEPADTGPLIMRVRHMCDARASATDPNPANADPLPQCADGEQGLVQSWIVDGDNGPEVISTLNSYLDAPELDPQTNVGAADHNVYSLGLPAALQGPVEFLDDGRMQIAGINQDDISVTMELSAVGGFAGGSVTLQIPKEGIQLSFLSQAPKR